MAELPLLGRPIWYELLTTSMKAAEDFYTNVVGWTTSSFDGAPQPYHMWHRGGGLPVGGVMTIPPGMNSPPHWEMYIAVPRLEEAVATIERLGGTVLGPLVQVPGVGRLRTMKDPQGAVFAIHEPESTPDPPEAPPEIGDVSWRELYTTDSAAAMTFYGAVFGWQPSTEMDMGPMGKYRIFKRGWDIGGMMDKPKEMAALPPVWLMYFSVPNADAGADRIKAGGGTIINGPMDVPGGRIVQGVDPQGAHFALHSITK